MDYWEEKETLPGADTLQERSQLASRDVGCVERRHTFIYHDICKTQLQPIPDGVLLRQFRLTLCNCNGRDKCQSSSHRTDSSGTGFKKPLFPLPFSIFFRQPL
jgi:hypothetical protein